MENVTQSVRRIRRRIAARFVVDIIIWFSVAIPVLYVFLHGTPYERGFVCDDAALSFPYKPDTISTPLLVAAGFTVSIIVIVMTEVLNCLDLKCRRRCATTEVLTYSMKTIAVFLSGFILEELVVKVVKNKMGVLRPNFFEVCRPQFNRMFCPGYITNYTCTTDNVKEIRTSRLSFPSGHASLSMYIAVFFCMHIEDHLQIGFSYILKLFMQTGLILMATLVGLDRVLDNKHHPSDVTVGFLLGMTIAIFVYYKIGRIVLICNDASSSTKETLQATDKSSYCWTCDTHAREPEPQTPAPLLQNEYLESLYRGNNTVAATPIFKDMPLYVRRHFSTPITPTTRFEDIV